MLSVGCSSGNKPWWVTASDGAGCGSAAQYRVGRDVQLSGDCAGNLSSNPKTVSLVVSHELDLHIRQGYSTVVSTNMLVLRQVQYNSEDGVTTFRAESKGDAIVQANGLCDSSGRPPQFIGPCPVVVVHVTSR